MLGSGAALAECSQFLPRHRNALGFEGREQRGPMIDANGLAGFHRPGIEPGNAKRIAQIAGLVPEVQQLIKGGWFLHGSATLPYVARMTIPIVAQPMRFVRKW